jgi:hypothetical protein
LIVKMSRSPAIKGSRPYLDAKGGVSDYEAFARKVLAAITDRPVSFEVFADDFASMAEQARTIAAWGPNVKFRSPTRRGQPSNESAEARAEHGARARARIVENFALAGAVERHVQLYASFASIARLTAIGFHLETLQMGRQLWQEGARIALGPRGCCAL